MPISLNHTIVAAADNERAARFFATVMGLHYTGYTGPERHFAPVRNT
jgi:predicted enzyme related to lactoylglutathione lyase